MRLQRISYINGGYAFKSTKYQEKGVRVIRISDFDENGLKYKNIVRYPYSEELNPYKLEDNNILLAMTGGTVGKSYLVERVDEPMYVNQRVATIKTLPCVEIKYINATILSDLIQKTIKHSKNSTNDNISMDTICNFLIPLPPLSEQKRIVKKIEELEPFIEEYGKAETELTALNTNFPEQIKKSILQYAIQGKLVEQDPNDEAASVLLEKIKKEKAELIKQGKIKKDKQESYIYKGADNRHYEKIGSEVRDITEEIPFDIPNNWSWCRLGSIVNIKGGKRIPKGMTFAENITKHIYIRVTDMKNGTISNTNLKYIDEFVFNEIKNYTISKTDLYLTIAGSIGLVGNVPDEFDGMNLTENAVKLTNIKIHKTFLQYTLTTPFAQQQFALSYHQVAQPKLSIETSNKTLIPLPPLSEQKRIVEKLEKIMQFIKTL